MKSSLTSLIVILVLAVVVLMASVYQVWETEQVVITKLGKPIRTVSQAGLHFKVPFIEKVNVFDRWLMDYDSSPTQILTQDKKTLIVDNYAKWRIVDPLKFLQAVRSVRGANTRLDDIIYSELRAELGRHKFHDIISTNRSEIMRVVTEKSNASAKAYGIEVLDVRIKRADLPQENEKAVFARMEAERKRIANQYRSEGEEEALKIRAETDKQAVILKATAEKQAQEVRGAGDAEATNVYAKAFGKNPRFYELVRTLLAYENSIDSSTTIILSPDADFFKYFWQAP